MFTCINVKSMKTKKIYKIKIKIKIIKIQETKLHSIPLFSGGIICGLHRRSFVVSFENHVRAYLGVIFDLATFSVGDYLLSGIICSRGSFAVSFGDHFRSGGHLRSGIICGAIQDSFLLVRVGSFAVYIQNHTKNFWFEQSYLHYKIEDYKISLY